MTTPLAKIHVGDTINLRGEDRGCLLGLKVHGSPPFVELPGHVTAELGSLQSDGWEFEIVTSTYALPTGSGAYTDNIGDIWVIGITGKLQLVTSGGTNRLYPYIPETDLDPMEYGPFTKLVPEGK